MWKTAFKKFKAIRSASADHITSNFLEVVFHKFYLVHSSILCPKCLQKMKWYCALLRKKNCLALWFFRKIRKPHFKQMNFLHTFRNVFKAYIFERLGIYIQPKVVQTLLRLMKNLGIGKSYIRVSLNVLSFDMILLL